MHFHANYISTSVSGDGDYCQVTFEAEQNTDDPDSPYLLIQRQFEDPNDNSCYIEAHDENTAFIFRCAASNSRCRSLVNRARRPNDNTVSATLATAATEFAEASQVVKIIRGEIEPP